MIKTRKIARGVKKILDCNMGLSDSETLLVVTDTPTSQEWQSLAPVRLKEMTLRNLLARTIADIARDQFPESAVIFQTYPSAGRHSAEPGKNVEEMSVGCCLGFDDVFDQPYGRQGERDKCGSTDGKYARDS